MLSLLKLPFNFHQQMMMKLLFHPLSNPTTLCLFKCFSKGAGLEATLKKILESFLNKDYLMLQQIKQSIKTKRKGLSMSKEKNKQTEGSPRVTRGHGRKIDTALIF